MSDFNKSGAIREAFDAIGVDSPSKDICEWVHKKFGQKVEETLVNNVRFHHKKKNGVTHPKTEEKRGRKAAVSPSQNGTSKTETDEVLASEHERMNAVAQVMRKVGGLKNLKEVVAKLEATLVAAGYAG